MKIIRDIYLKQLDFYLKTEQIKIITGARRSGKSFLLGEIINCLKERGIPEDHIIQLWMEDYRFDDYCDPHKFHDYIVKRMIDKNKYYIFIDEVQLIKDWERVINSLRLWNTCIFVTGSNSKLLSGELRTLLSGRYIQFQVRNVMFKDYYNSLKKENPLIQLEDAFNYYVNNGNYPVVLSNQYTFIEAQNLTQDIFQSSVLRDVVERNQVRDIALLNNLINYMIDNTGRLTSARNIWNYLNSNKIKVQFRTITNYLELLQEALIIEKVGRYDIKGKQLLSTIDKYYLVDHSLLYRIRATKEECLSQIYENIVFNDLRARGYQVWVGKIKEYEVDFIAQRADQKIYIQVTRFFNDGNTKEREIRPLKLVSDNYRKYVVTMDRFLSGNTDGVQYEYLPNFLLKKEL